MYPKELQSVKASGCACGKCHVADIKSILCGAGVLRELPAILRDFQAKKPYILCDRNTFAAAGERVCALLEGAGIPYAIYTYKDERPAPNEENVGKAFMFLPADCDLIIGVGSGVINDIGKIVSNITGKPYVIVGTAPSMDGYASASSSMTREGLKISLASRAPDVIIGDTDILCNAPLKMMKSGLGDMLAKYVSICEWRIAHLITGEYYCEEIAALVRGALRRCVELSDKLLARDPEAVAAVFEGLVVTGIAMTYAGVSRPASGVEHYLSHVWDMRALEFGTPEDLHGIQCAVGTLISAKIYEKLKAITPDREKALSYVQSFDFAAWSAQLRAFLGKSAEAMIALEEKEQKYNKEAHRARLEVILQNWDAILQIIDEELPSSAAISALLDAIDAPKSMADIGLDENTLPMTFFAAKDIRDKYVLPRLAWDLGVLEELI
ncbi:MAG: sn-glycerol-1-phosphate dehydrogenase [Ruminococcaceae bacterium]|nr:sn-glycerol-1-phosphate dehydrogenase [Oscillospiraceae bacterium]